MFYYNINNYNKLLSGVILRKMFKYYGSKTLYFMNLMYSLAIV